MEAITKESYNVEFNFISMAFAWWHHRNNTANQHSLRLQPSINCMPAVKTSMLSYSDGDNDWASWSGALLSSDSNVCVSGEITIQAWFYSWIAYRRERERDKERRERKREELEREERDGLREREREREREKRWNLKLFTTFRSLLFFKHNFVSIPENPEGTQVIVGCMNMGYDIYIRHVWPGIELTTCSVSSARRNPLGHSDWHLLRVDHDVNLRDVFNCEQCLYRWRIVEVSFDDYFRGGAMV